MKPRRFESETIVSSASTAGATESGSRTGVSVTGAPRSMTGGRPMLAEPARCSVRQAALQQSEDVAAHDRGDVGVSQALGEERVGQLVHAGRVKRARDSAIEVRAEPDVF